MTPLTLQQQALVLSGIPLAERIARRWTRAWRGRLEWADVRGEAMLALCHAAAHYDPAAGAWAHYAARVVKRRLQISGQLSRALTGQARGVARGMPVVPCDMSLAAIPEPAADPFARTDARVDIQALLSRTEISAEDTEALRAYCGDPGDMAELARLRGVSRQQVSRRAARALRILAAVRG